MGASVCCLDSGINHLKNNCGVTKCNQGLLVEHINNVQHNLQMYFSRARSFLLWFDCMSGDYTETFA